MAFLAYEIIVNLLLITDISCGEGFALVGATLGILWIAQLRLHFNSAYSCRTFKAALWPNQNELEIIDSTYFVNAYPLH